MEYGLTEYELKRIIQKELEKNPDLQFYINNPYFDELLSLLIDGITKAIAANTREVFDNIESESRRRF